ncbi:MAG TPA: aldo/keto reductase [Victivallales bacterium]|nr:aldo/keto reductase [Victivallales bacterium]
MEYRKLGKAGLKLSVFSFGSWVTFHKQIDSNLAYRMMSLAYDNGVNFFDNAEVYENGLSEKVMGSALKKLSWPRSSYCVSSKVFWGGEKPTQKGLSRKHVVDACHAALKRLNVDYLDLYFCHRPDIDTPIEETVRAMHDLIQQGKVLYWGTSQWRAQQISEAYGIARELHLIPPTVEQPEYNMFCREKIEKEFLPLYDSVGLGTTIWSPLDNGVLTGKYNNGIPEDSRFSLSGYDWSEDGLYSDDWDPKIKKVIDLCNLSDEFELPVHHMALLWCLKNKNVSSVIIGASKIDQLKDNLSSLENYRKMTVDLMDRIENILANKPIPVEKF